MQLFKAVTIIIFSLASLAEIQKTGKTEVYLTTAKNWE